jgi:uncharacterized protein YjbJ (UPF0337 family)
MNKDQIKGAAKEAAGKIQRKTGELIGSPEQQARGATKEVAGKAQKHLGKLKEDLKDGTRA